MNAPRTGVLEAGTGLGKSLAYLFASFKRKYETDQRGPVIIACNTKHLQDQLFFKDLPQLADALKTSVSALIIKGRKIIFVRLDLIGCLAKIIISLIKMLRQ